MDTGIDADTLTDLTDIKLEVSADAPVGKRKKLEGEENDDGEGDSSSPEQDLDSDHSDAESDSLPPSPRVWSSLLSPPSLRLPCAQLIFANSSSQQNSNRMDVDPASMQMDSSDDENVEPATEDEPPTEEEVEDDDDFMDESTRARLEGRKLLEKAKVDPALKAQQDADLQARREAALEEAKRVDPVSPPSLFFIFFSPPPPNLTPSRHSHFRL